MVPELEKCNRGPSDSSEIGEAQMGAHQRPMNENQSIVIIIV
jgi:hypothetical protein